MSKDGWLKILEESRMARESLQQSLRSLSEMEMRVRDGIEKTYKNLWTSVEMIEESRRLLELMNQLRDAKHNVDVQISRVGEIISSDLILAEHQTESAKASTSAK